MSIRHHPAEDLLLAYAAGGLDQGQHLVLATHIRTCRACRDAVRALEGCGGALLDALPPTPMGDEALAAIEARLDRPAAPAAGPACAPARADAVSPDIAALPPFARALPAGKWRWLAPQMHLRRLKLSEPAPTRVFLLRAQPGVKLLPHEHTGFEMTCVLTGSFHHDGTRYGPGDFDWGDSGIGHEVEIGDEGECVSIVAMQGELRLTGLLGRLIQPLVAI